MKNFITIIVLLGFISANISYYANNFNANEQVLNIMNALGKALENSSDPSMIMG